MILAAGAGTRLRPLTLARPKPMVPVVNKPNIGHVLDKLKRAGIKTAAANLHMAPEQIRRYAGSGKKWGLEIVYSLERELLGTAGSLGPLKKYFQDEPFFVLSGDVLSDISLLELAAYHIKNKAIATVVVVKTDAKFDYGLVQMNEDRMVQAFLEKPNWGDIFSPYINTGIYLFEPEVLRLIPDHGFFDYARDLWPRLIAQGAGAYAYIHDGYWKDIGNLKEYRSAHKDILNGNTDIQLEGHEMENQVWVGDKVNIEKGAHLQGPAVIGHGVTIKKNAKINPYSVIGNGCVIGESAAIADSILWEKVNIAARVQVAGCVLADETILKESVAFYEGAILGASITT